MIKGLLSTVLVIWFFTWIMFGATPNHKIERFCAPTSWGGAVVVSLSMLFGLEAYRTEIQQGVNQVVFGCRFSVWRLIYEKDYIAEQERLKTANSPNDPIAQKSEKKPEDKAVYPDGSIR